jgi:hypothetical protein
MSADAFQVEGAMKMRSINISANNKEAIRE